MTAVGAGVRHWLAVANRRVVHNDTSKVWKGSPSNGQLRAQTPRAWEGFVIVVRIGADGEPLVIQQWVRAADLRPAVTDPNRAFGLP